MGDETSVEPISEQRPAAAPDPASPSASVEVTKAFDSSTKPEDNSAIQVPASEPPADQTEQPVPVRHKSLSFLQPGTRPGSLGRLGHFEVLELLGKGGFGIVLKALDDKLQRLVAIKVLGPQLTGSANARSRFVREARAAAAVNSKHVVSTYEVYEQPIPYLVMEYVAGKSLQDRLDRLEPFTTRDILRLGAEIAAGLAAAHQQGLIHRDIKPANILLELRIADCGLRIDKNAENDVPNSSSESAIRNPQSAMGRVKIADFGLARAVDDISLTQSGMIAGTPLFMSPEQARGETLDSRSDLFSLGSVLYTLCTSHPPFKAHTTLGVMKRVCDDTPRPIREINAAIPEALVDIVNRLLVKDPAGRIQTATEVAELLEQQLAHLDEPAPSSPSGGLAGGAITDHLPEGSPRLEAVELPQQKVRLRRKPRSWRAAACVLLGVVVAAVALTESTGLTRWWQMLQPTPDPLENGERPEDMGPRPDFTNTLGMKFKLIPAGKFSMGSPKEEIDRFRGILGVDDGYVTARLPAEVPEHAVAIAQPFYLGTTEVTLGQFRQFVEETRYQGDALWTKRALQQTDDHPVSMVSWQNAVDFCNWLSAKEGKKYRLPTEAEWEYCCRAGKSGTRYCFGDDEAQLEHYAWYRGNSGNETHPVGQKKPNDWGLSDMHGNVWEWCQDRYQADYYRNSPVYDPPGGVGGGHVIRGGSLGDGPVACRSGFRYDHPADVGFRVALVMPVDEVLAVLRKQPPDDPQLQLALARKLAERGKQCLAERQSAKAQADLETARDLFKRQDLKNSEMVDLHIALGEAHAQQGQTNEAVAAFVEALPLAADRASKARLIAAAAPLQGVLENLAERAAGDGPFQAELTRHFAKEGNAPLATATRTKARALLEEQLAREPETFAWAAELAQLLLDQQEMEKAARWTVLKPTELKSRAGATLTLQGDGSILASGVNASGDLYTVSAVSTLDRIAAIRLEALPDPSLPKKGPGRHSSGNFQLSAFRCYQPTKEGRRTPLPVESAWASFDFKAPNADIAGTVDARLKQVWHVWGRFGEAHQAVFLVRDTAGGRDRPLVIELQHQAFAEGINLGRFRLSVSGDPATSGREWHRFAAMKITEPRARLAAAYHLLGDQQAVAKLLKHHPATAGAIGDLYVAAEDWQRAIAEYRKAISDQPADGTLSEKLATAHNNQGVALYRRGQLDEGIASYREAVKLKPKSPIPYTNLGLALSRQGQVDEAIASFRKGIEVDPKNAIAHRAIASVRKAVAQRHAARGEWRAAADSYAQLFAEQPLADGELGFEYAVVLLLAGDETGYRKRCAELLARSGQVGGIRPYHVARACTLAPDSVKDPALPAQLANNELQRNRGAFWSLTQQGALAYRAGRSDQAASLLEQSLKAESQPGRAVMAWLWLSLVEQRRGKPAEARAWLEKATKWMAEYPGGFPVLADEARGLHLHNWLEGQVLRREAERELGLVKRLSAILRGEDRLKDNAERLVFARLAYDHKHFAAAARLWAEALQGEPKLADDRQKQHRYNAACAGALAAAGQAREEPPLDEAAKAKLRRQALDWLRAELTVLSQQLPSERPGAAAQALAILAHWQKDTDLAGIRHAAALAKLPADERAAFTQLWADVAAFLKKSAEKPK